MILTHLDQADRYAGLHPGFAAAFAFLRQPALAQLPPGRVALDGDRLYASIDHGEGRGRDQSPLEVHRRYIDVQFVVAGLDEIGWRPLHRCAKPAGGFDASRDIGFFLDAPETWTLLYPGCLAILFPEDAHAPLAGAVPVHKVVVKISAGWPPGA